MKRAVIAIVAFLVLFVGAAIGWGLYDDTRLRPFVADEWLEKSFQTAQAARAGAKPIEITAEAVTPDGKVHLEQRGYLIVRFRDPPAADATPAPSAIPGARFGTAAPGACPGGVVRTHARSATQRHFEHAWAPEDQKCLPYLDGPPKCTFEQIWQKAKAKGAPDPGYADIDLAQEVGGGGSEKRWRFEIVDRPADAPMTTVFHAEFPDDC